MKIIITIKILSLLGKTILNSIGLTEKVIQPKIQPIIDDYQFWLFKADLDKLENDPVEVDVYLKEHGLDQVQGLKDYISNNKNIKQNSVNNLIQAQNYQNIAKQAHGISGVKKAIDEYNNSLTKLDNGTTEVSANTTKFTKALAGTNTKLANFMTNAKGSKITLGSYAKSLAIAKIKTIGLQAATMAMNMAMSMGISFVLSKFIEGIQYLTSANERYLEKQQETIDKANETISTTESQITALENLKDKLDEARYSQAKMNSLADELNDTLGSGTSKILEQANAYEILNLQIEREIELQKEAAKKAEEERSTAEFNTALNTEVENSGFGRDMTFNKIRNHRTYRVSSAGTDVTKTAGEYADELITQAIEMGEFSDSLDEYAKIYREALEKANDYSKGDELSLPSEKELKDGFKDILDHVHSAFSNTVNDLNSFLTTTEINNIIDRLFMSGITDSNEISESLKEIFSDTDVINNLWSEYLDKLKNDIDGDEDIIYNQLISMFDKIKESYPVIAEILDNYFNDMVITLEDKAIEVSSKGAELIDLFDEAFNAADFADSKEKLLELAKSGEITADVLESTAEYKTLLTQTGLSAEGAKLKILGMLTATEKLSAASKGMDSLSTAFNEWQDKGFVTAETLEALPDAFKKDTKKFDLFSQIVGDPTNSKAEIQQAFNDIATEYLKTQGTLGKITEENTESYIANLKDMGITNAEEIIKDYKTSKDEFGTLLSEAYEEWQTHLNDDEQTLEAYLLSTDTKNAELMNAFGEEYSTDYQNWLDLLQKKKDAYETYRAAIEGNLVQTPDESKDTKYAWAKTDQLMNQHLADMNYYEYEDIQDEFEKYSAKLASSKFTSNSLDYTGSKDSSSSSSKDTSQTYDWIETKIKRLNEVLDSIKAKADNVYSSWTERNTELANAISNTKEAIDLQSQAYSRYIQEANSVGLSPTYKELVEIGAIDINTISDETLKEKISDYQTW